MGEFCIVQPEAGLYIEAIKRLISAAAAAAAAAISAHGQSKKSIILAVPIL